MRLSFQYLKSTAAKSPPELCKPAKTRYTQNMQILSLFFLCLFAAAQPEIKNYSINENPLTARATLEPSQLFAGANGTVHILLELAPQHHAYVDQFRLQILDSDFVRVGKPQIAPVVDFDDPFTKKVKQVVHDKATMNAALELAQDIPAKYTNVKLALTYQACTKEHCLFPKTLEIPLHFEVLGGGGSLPTVHTGDLASRINSAFVAAMKDNLVLAFILVFIAGVLTSLTPCIFPMIPITLAVLGVRHPDRTRAHRLFISACYVLGIAITYSLVGVVVAQTGALFGALLGNFWVICALCGLFILMGLSMLGLFEVALPAVLQTKLSRTSAGEGVVGALISGLIAGLVASPCVGPVLVSILTYVAQTQNAGLGFSLLFVFALGMGQLFLLLGASTELLDRLPKSGPWMDGVKRVFAVSFFALALWYARPLLSTSTFYLAAAGFLCTSTWIAGLFKFGMPKTGTGIIYRTLLMGVFFYGVYLGAKGFEHVIHEPPNAENRLSLKWLPFSEERLQTALAEHRPVIIDFWADWCVACKELEVATFSAAEVRSFSESFVLLKFDATQTTSEFEALKKRYEIVGLPHLVFYDTSGNWRKDLTLTGFESAVHFLRRMQGALPR